MLDRIDIAEAQARVQRGETRVGPQHEDAVIASLVGELAGIDLEGAAVGGGAQVAAIGGVADQRFVAALELLIEPGDDGLAIGSVLGRLGLVAADDVAPPLDLDLLANSWVCSPLARSTQSGVNGFLSASTTVRTKVSVRSRAPSTYSSPRSSSAVMVAAEIMPRAATTQTRPMPKRLRRRSMTGTSTPTSAVLPGHISEQTGRPSASITTPRIICIRSGRWSLE